MILPAKILRLAIKKLSLMVVIILRTFIDEGTKVILLPKIRT